MLHFNGHHLHVMQHVPAVDIVIAVVVIVTAQFVFTRRIMLLVLKQPFTHTSPTVCM